jgi:hypothetical protein
MPWPIERPLRLFEDGQEVSWVVRESMDNSPLTKVECQHDIEDHNLNKHAVMQSLIQASRSIEDKAVVVKAR